jgi:hypothetical protein
MQLIWFKYMIVCLITSELSLEESSLILLLNSIQLIGSLCIAYR